MSAKNKKSAAPQPLPSPAPIAPGTESATTPTVAPFDQRHPKIANVLFAALWVYVAMLALLALDQTFHWGILGSKILPTP